jgi:alkylation response protein AidB-like acyl-CoA dehydrogenase
MTMRKVGAWALTETGSGSDAFGGMRSSARRQGDDFVLNGSKTFITNGPHADTIVFICRLDKGAPEPRDRPIMTFVLERGTPGLVQSGPLQKMGMHSSPTGELFLDDVRVPIEQLLGGLPALERALQPRSPRKTEGSGNKQAKGAFASERASIAATALGVIERCLELSVEHARQRVQFGQAIGQFQLIQDKLARLAG